MKLRREMKNYGQYIILYGIVIIYYSLLLNIEDRLMKNRNMLLYINFLKNRQNSYIRKFIEETTHGKLSSVIHK